MNPYQVFISYAKKDRSTAERLARAISSAGIKVFIDYKSLSTKKSYYGDQIEKAIEDVECVLVLWSKESIGSDFVKSEAELALKLGKILSCVIDIDLDKVPFRFRNLQVVDMQGWRGERNDLFQNLTSALASYLPKWTPATSNDRFSPDAFLIDEVRNFLPAAELRNAANVAIASGRPLLISGEYGMESKLFAAHLADALQTRYHEFDADYDSTVKDLFYGLRSDRISVADKYFADDTQTNLEKRSLWMAFEAKQREVYFISGLERTTTGFQLGLALILSKMSFYVDELRLRVSCRTRPIVILNVDLGAGVLPDYRLLRLCVPCHIPQPNSEELAKLLTSKVASSVDPLVVQNAVVVFMLLRATKPTMYLSPSISDLIDWVRLLSNDPLASKNLALNDRSQDGTLLRLADVPFWEMLVHDPRDVNLLSNQSGYSVAIEMREDDDEDDEDDDDEDDDEDEDEDDEDDDDVKRKKRSSRRW